jgi:subtilisin family serine protease
MATANYILVRKDFLSSTERAPTAEVLVDADRGGPVGTPDAFIKLVESIDERDVPDLVRDPAYLAAPSIPVSLVMPVGISATSAESVVDEAMAKGGSWGVLDVASESGDQAGSNIVVAVLDTGIDPDHPAFRGVALEQKNFSNSPYPDDKHGHGTHCAGTIFGRDLDGVRIGVARGVRKALVGKVLDDNGRGTSEAIANGIQWAQMQGAQVISLSVGIDFGKLVIWYEEQGKERAEALSSALAAFRDTVRAFDGIALNLRMRGAMQRRGVIAVAASGNESARNASKPYVVDVSLPAAAVDVMSVGAVGRGAQGYDIAPFSNVNPQLCAPGVDIVSARRGGGLSAESGTSMAAPHVAGLAALWWEDAIRDNPNATGDLVRSRIIAGCRRTGFASSATPSDRGAGLARAPA